jgi:replicative DNA helicase
MDNFDQLVEQRKMFKIAGSYGIQFLDQLLLGIMPEDFVLIGAETGVGKTELAYEIAFRNSIDKNVHLFALEAEQGEPYYRKAYKLIAQEYFENVRKNRLLTPHIDMSYRNYITNKVDMSDYEKRAFDTISTKYSGLTVHYKKPSYTLHTFLDDIQNVVSREHIEGKCEMIVLDHVDYFDSDYMLTETQQVSQIMKSLRQINQDLKIPIIVISHLRKKSNRKCIVPDPDDFIGSGDKAKQVKTIVMLSRNYPGDKPEQGLYSTIIYVPKSRIGGGENIVAIANYNRAKNAYDKGYEIGIKKSYGEEIELIVDPAKYPKWYKKDEDIIHAPF